MRRKIPTIMGLVGLIAMQNFVSYWIGPDDLSTHGTNGGDPIGVFLVQLLQFMTGLAGKLAIVAAVILTGIRLYFGDIDEDDLVFPAETVSSISVLIRFRGSRYSTGVVPTRFGDVPRGEFGRIGKRHRKERV